MIMLIHMKIQPYVICYSNEMRLWLTLVFLWLPLWKCIYILWNRLDRTCYKCIIRLHNYVPYEALKSRLLCLGFPHNSHTLCLKIDMIIINKCCIAHWTVLIHISMYFVKFSVLLFFIKVLQGSMLFLFSVHV